MDKDSSSSNLPLSKATIEIRKLEIISRQYESVVAKIVLFFSIFLVAYAYGLDGSVRSVYSVQAASSYQTHSLYATVNVIRAVIAAAAQFAFARLSDVFGRLSLFIVSILFYAVGTVIQSQAYDIQRFAAGSVFYQIGYTGAILMLQLILADHSNLNWRLLCSFIPALPFIINTWISGDVTAAVGLDNWSWGIAMWAFIFPLSCIPLLACMIHQRWMVRKDPEWIEVKAEEKLEKSKTSFGAKLVDLFWKIDLIGLLFVILVFGLILVPFTIAGGVSEQWKKAKIIVPLVLGFVLIPFFAVWEKYAKFPLIPFHLLKDRGVWAAVIVGVFVDLVWYLPNDYMYTVLIVAVHESIKSATRITSVYSFVSVICGTFLGFVVVKFRYLKPFIIFGATLWFVANGLLVHFRGSSDSHSGIIGALALYGFGAGFFTYSTQASIQSCTSHKNMASITALYLSSYNIGAAIGAAVSGAVWTQLLYKQLLKKLGDSKLATECYSEPFVFIATYTWETTERQKAVLAYMHVQKILCVIGLCLCVPLLVACLFLRNHRLESVQSLKNVEEIEAEESLPINPRELIGK